VSAPPAAPPPPGSVRWTSRAFLLVTFAGGLVALAVALSSPVPLFAAIPLLVAPVLAGLHNPVGLAGVDLDWRESGIGSEVRIDGVLRGDFGGSAPDISVDLRRPFGLAEAEPLRFDRGPEVIRFSTVWTLAEPAILTLAPPGVVWQDPLGLAERSLEGTRPPLSVERYPPPIHRTGAIRLEHTTPLPGDIRSRLLGGSGEFFGLRRAFPDDPPRRINWQASARTGRLLANEYRLDRTGDLVIVLDVRPTPLGAEVDNRLLGVARAAVFGIAESFLRGKVRIGFATFGDFLEAVPLSTGRIHRRRVLHAVLAARRSRVAGPAERAAFSLRRFYRPGVTTLVVSAWTGDETLNLVPYLARQGFPAALLCPSPLPMRAGTGGLPAEDEPLAERLELLQRRAWLSELWEDGPVVDWDDYWTLEPLARLLRRPPYRRVS
jgi:uncharacterized protein (DUF58 family)